ncbi:MAG: hypothetical protein JNL60_11495 [Bacteroidia bacterium]|nr:hypothetical protein [Bacteroidia bacterium]
MKKLLPGIIAILLVLCSCNAKKTFLHQRYTHFKHHNPAVASGQKTKTDKANVANVATPEVVQVTAQTEAATANPANEQKTTAVPKLKYTRAVLNDVAKRLALKDNDKSHNLIASNSKEPVSQVNKVKPLKTEVTKQKRGLLWGVIDALLAIILIVVIVLLVTWLVIVLTGPAY